MPAAPPQMHNAQSLLGLKDQGFQQQYISPQQMYGNPAPQGVGR